MNSMLDYPELLREIAKYVELLDVESPQSTKSPFRPKVLLANETVYFIGAWHQSEFHYVFLREGSASPV